MEKDTRYPYTYAADLLRSLAGYGVCGAKIDRSDAGRIRCGIAEAIGMSDAELATKLADYYKANEATITERSVKEFQAYREAL
jgi:hypothetical protein